jgi:Alpha/beta hydrolase domain
MSARRWPELSVCGAVIVVALTACGLALAGCASGGSHGATSSSALPAAAGSAARAPRTARASAAPDLGPVLPPTVQGPIPSTPSDFPFVADGYGPEPPVPHGYEESEYFVSGRANLYEYTRTGVRIVSPCPPSAQPLGCADIPYTTRMLVKRPVDSRRFSGTVVVEPLNPSSGYDIANVWDRSWPYFVRQGDIFVGWTSRYKSIGALKQFEPGRYAPLRWGQDSEVDDGITFDIAAQLGALFRLNRSGSPTHELKVRHVFESGFSQDGGFTFTQADVFNAIDRLPNGGPVYDGYIPGGTLGPSDIDFGLTPRGALQPDDPRNRMQPRDVPVIQINTETEEASLGRQTGLPYRRPDSDARGDRYRLWEVPGASHISDDLGTWATTEERDLAEIKRVPLSAIPSTGCTHQRFVAGAWTGVRGTVDPNPYPFGYIADAAFADLTRWVDRGVPPPHAPPLETTASGDVARDRFGNALGGVRTPFVDVPTATYSPSDTASHYTDLAGLCILMGYGTPLSDATLRSLYGSHADYVMQVKRDSDELVRDGFWLGPDAAKVVAQAANSDIP